MIATGEFVVCFAVVWALVAWTVPTLIRFVRTIAGTIARRFKPVAVLRGRSPLVTWIETYWSVLVIVIAGAFLAVWAGDGFFDIAEEIRAESAVGQQVDRVTYEWLRTHRDAPDTTFFVGATMFGSPVSMAIIVVAVVAGLLWRHRYRWAAYVAGTSLGGVLLDELLKRHFARVRPDLALAVLRARGYSFPSGHAMGSMVVLGAVAYVAIRGLGPWWQKSCFVAFVVTAVLAIAFSRIYLGVHWISDVAAGLCAGIVWLGATTTAYETVRRLRILRARSGTTRS